VSLVLISCNLDIGLLHEIVVKAESLLPTFPEQERFPTHALFTAYHELFAQKGRITDGETKFSRILFKIGGAPDHLTLLENFENVLARIGIDVEFSVKDGTTHPSLDGISGKREDDIYSDHGDGTNESASLDIEVSTKARTPAPSVVKWPQAQHRLSYDAGRYINGYNDIGNDYLGFHKDAPPSHDPTSSEIDYHRTTNSPHRETAAYDHSVAPSEATIADMREALALRHFRRYTLMHIVEYWKTSALQQREDNIGLMTVAEHRDRNLLFQNAIELWRSSLGLKRNAKGAVDPDTALARRHIVRTKFYNAWKNLTLAKRSAVQKAEEEAQRGFEEKRASQLKEKYFQHWRTVIAQRKADEDAAQALFSYRLKRKFFGFNLLPAKSGSQTDAVPKEKLNDSAILPQNLKNSTETLGHVTSKTDVREFMEEHVLNTIPVDVVTNLKEGMLSFFLGQKAAKKS